MAKKRRSHKQGIISQAINASGLLIAFSQGIGNAIVSYQAGGPKEALRGFVSAETGLDITGQAAFQPQLLQNSIIAKIIGIIWVKVAHQVSKRMRVSM